MSQKHTPGPWEKVELGVISNKITTYGNYYVHATVDTENEELEANAKLIAAAPDMLALLQEWAGDEPGFNGPDWHKRVQEAITKATI